MSEAKEVCTCYFNRDATLNLSCQTHQNQLGKILQMMPSEYKQGQLAELFKEIQSAINLREGKKPE